MKNNYQPLQKFGLSENEIKVYVESLKQTDLTPYKLSKLTGIPRTTVYDVLMSLSLKGLVELEQSDGIQKQQTKVRGKNPSILRKIIRDRQKALTDLEVDIVDILPELKASFHKQCPNANFKFFPGIEGVKKIYFDSDLAEIDLPQYAWDMLIPMDVFGQDNLNRAVSEGNKSRKRMKYKEKELIPLNDWTRHVMTYQYQRDKNYLSQTEFRFIDQSAFEVFLRLAIKGDHVRIACAHEDETWGVSIRSRSLAKTLKAIYEMNWLIATPITKETIKSWGENEYLKAQREKRTIQT